jgi:hypothetical protein
LIRLRDEALSFRRKNKGFASLAKATVVLGLVISLIGGVAPRLIKADGNIDAIVKGEANVALGFGEAKAKPEVKAKSAATSKAVAKKSTKAAVKKGNKTMTTIDSILNGVGKASSLPGE